MRITVSYCTICNRPFPGTGVCEVCYTMMEQVTLKTEEPVEEPVTLQLTKTQYEALAKLLDILTSDEFKSIAEVLK